MITPAATALCLMLVVQIPIIAAQTEANCTDIQYTWTFNSVGLSPCHVAGQLSQPCTPTLNIPPLPEGDIYVLPSAYQNDTCVCNSVFYSLLSACGACQNHTWISWARFMTTCAAPTLTIYPDPIPPNVKVPHWAYLNVNDTGSFNVSVAQNASGPESTSPASATSTSFTPTSTSSSASSSASSSTSSSNSSSTSFPTSSSQSSSAGPIAGGVVGGVVGVALIAVVAFFYRRRGRHSPDQSNGVMSSPDVLSTSPPTAWNAPPLVPGLRPQKLYDPQDPSTFPQNTYTNVPQSLTGTTFTTGPRGTHYAGVPEV